ncbi:MAG: hypothetical protein D6830_06570 [Ignavibacteria bacterium]|nr:MAG: hypothetical protein D6830_06570 [Ignavibacteria bacterium]
MKKLAITAVIFFMPILILAQEENCSNDNCHTGINTHEYEHPAMEDGCSTCHDGSISNHPQGKGNEFELNEEMPELCYQCHDAPDEKLNVHPALESGDCTTCHNPHGSDNETILRDENPGNLCFECHDVDEDEGIVKHGPVISRQCIACHNPHASELPTLLRAEPPELCFNCHTQKQEQLNMETVHPAYEGSCTDCHMPHNSHEKYLLKEKAPQLCYECHDDKAEEIDSAKVVHKVINQKQSCVECHNPHATNTETLLKKTGSDLCFECHDRTYKDKETKRKIKNIKNIVVNAKTPHPPVAEGECVTCHNPHYSSNNFLLKGAFPFGAYAEKPNSSYFQLCFDCHDSDKLDKEFGTEFTDFRKGNKNLHYFHISKNKGRNCTMCHEVHGSQKPHLIAKKVKFGNWMMPLNYKESKNGGSCMPGCHQRFEYDRTK